MQVQQQPADGRFAMRQDLGAIDADRQPVGPGVVPDGEELAIARGEQRAEHGEMRPAVRLAPAAAVVLLDVVLQRAQAGRADLEVDRVGDVFGRHLALVEPEQAEQFRVVHQIGAHAFGAAFVQAGC